MSLKNKLAIILFSVIIIRVAWMCYEKPLYNWDTLPYMAILQGSHSIDAKEIHRETYTRAKIEIPQDRYALMIDTSHVLKKRLLLSPSDFNLYSSFFRTRPLYTGLASICYQAGAPLSKAVVLPSVLSFLGMAWLLLLILVKHLEAWLAVVVSISIILSPPVLEAARLATPDALSTMILLLYFLLILSRSPQVVAFAILSLSILARLDNLVFAIVAVCFQLLASFASQLKPSKTIVVSFLCLWIFYAVWITVSEGLANAYDSFYGDHMSKFNPIVVLKDALYGVNTLQTSYLSTGVVVCGVSLFYKAAFMKLNQHQILFLMLLSYLVLRYVMFPDLTTRFFLIVFVMSVALTVIAIATAKSNEVRQEP